MLNSELLRYINMFREKAEQRKLVIFVGAGVSCNVEGMPDWDGVIQNMARAINYSKCSACRHKTETCGVDCKFRNDFSTDEFLKIPQYVFNQNENLYWKIFRKSIPNITTDAPLSSAILDVNPAHIITTNYDHLLESSSNEFCEQYQVIVHDRDLLDAQKGKYIIKMHGNLSDDDSIVFKEQDYLDYSQNHILIELFVKALLVDHVVLFLGYSLNDYNIKLIISWLNYMRTQNEALTATQKVGYIISDREQIDENQRAYFSGNNIDIINIHEMPLIDEIPSSLKNEQGKRLYSFLRVVADASLEKGFSPIEDAVYFLSAYTFVDYEKILRCLYINHYEVLGWQLRLYSENDYLRLVSFMERDVPEAAQLRQLFINAGILWIEFTQAFERKKFAPGKAHESILFQNKAFNLYIQNQYNELGTLIGNDISDTIERNFYRSIIDGYSDTSANYNAINFSSLCLDQKVAYLHNQAALQALKTYSFDSRQLEHFIQNLASNKEQEMFSTYLDVLNGSTGKRLEMQAALSKLKKDVQAKATIHLGGTSISQIYKIKPLAMTQYFFYFFNHLFFKGFSDLPTFLQPYIEAIICANSEDVEVPIQWDGETITYEKYPIGYIDIDIITKFISTDDLYSLLTRHRVKKLNIDADNISFLVACFENICASIVTARTYGYRFSSITTLANIAVLLNLVELSNEHLESLENAFTILFYDNQAMQILFSTQCTNYKSILRALSTLCKSLVHSTDIEIVRRIITTQGFFDYAVNVTFSLLRDLVLSFIQKQDIDSIQSSLQAIVESVKDFSCKVILLRLFYPRITNQDIRNYYNDFLSSNFSQLGTKAIYDLALPGWITPTQEALDTFLNDILELHRNRLVGLQRHPDPVETNLACVYLLYISGILTDITALKELAPEKPHLQFLLDPDTFNYSQVDFADYMWMNFARQREYMTHFIAHKDALVPRIRERIRKGNASEDEKKILYGFLLDGDEIWIR